MDRNDRPRARHDRLPGFTFHFASLVLFCMACAFWYVAYMWDRPYFPSWQLMTVVSILIAVSMLLFVWPAVLRARMRMLVDLPDVMREMRDTVLDAEAILKEYRRARTAIEALRESVEAERTQVEAVLHDAEQSLLNLREKDEELQAKRRECEALSREIAAWAAIAMEYLDALHQGIAQLDAQDPRSGAMIRSAEAFGRYCVARGLECINPAAGAPLVQGLYQVVDEEDSDDAPPGTILRCTEWGYRVGAEIVRKAKVVISRQSDRAEAANSTG